jgi:hypothetical protein
MKTITLNEAQVKFLYNALESARDRIWEDPSAYGWEEEEWEENEEKVEKEIEAFQKDVVYDVLKKLK